MKQYIMTIVMLFSISPLDAEYKKSKQQMTFMDCLPSTVVSSFVGAFTGGLTRYLEKELKVFQTQEDFIFLMIEWWIEHKVRCTIINNLEQDFYEADIPHKRGLMRFAAWASSWIAYFKV